MLDTLTIRNIALIEEVVIQFHGGLQVLTGETGAGKSIVVDAVNLILGGRADKDLIRSGTGTASVEAVFLVRADQRIRSFMEREQIEYDGRTVTVYREISANGKNVCRICGVLLPVARLKELASFLLDLHGQSEHQFLTDTEQQLLFLDQIGDRDHQALLEKAKEDCEAFLNNHREYARLVKQNETREERMKKLEKDLEELKGANIDAGEEESLAEERTQLLRAESEAALLRNVYECFLAGETGKNSLAEIKRASDCLKQLASKDDQYRVAADRCESLYYELEEIAYELSMALSKNDFSPQRLENIQNRLDLIRRFEKKYGVNASRLPAMQESMKEEFESLLSLADRVTAMAAEHKRLLKQYRATAAVLTESRKKIAKSFENRMMKELSELGMENTQFSVRFIANDTGRPLMPSEKGDDRIEFMISPNPGEPLKPLAKIASGGELSRMMLAVKTMEAAHTGVESMVFDEIDTGISGRMAQTVAEKMISISRSRQVICVTHLPQIAAAADYQYLVQKSVADRRTHTSVQELDAAGRIDEVGRMISGADGLTDESAAHAAQMIQAAESVKKSRDFT